MEHLQVFGKNGARGVDGGAGTGPWIISFINITSFYQVVAVMNPLTFHDKSICDYYSLQVQF